MSHLGQIRSLYIAPVHSSVWVSEYMTIDSGVYYILYTNNRRALIAAWLNASQRSGDGVRLNTSTRE